MPAGTPSATLKPLSPIAISTMVLVRGTPCPSQEVNPGVIDRLLREALIEFYDAPSPYKTRKGTVKYFKLTPAGEARLVELGR